MQFDYYSASVPASISHCLDEMKKDFSIGFSRIDGIARYPQGYECANSGVRVYSGSSQPAPLMVASGGSAVQAADFIRRVYPKHKVTRLDAAQDYSEKGAFDRICGIIDPICRDLNVKCMFQGDIHPEQTDGRTMYFGSKDSDVRMCLYEKGLEQIGKGDLNADPDWVRMELRVKFRKELKEQGAILTPEQLYGRSRWSVKVAEQVLGKVAEFIPDPSHRKSSAMHSFEHMQRQYAGVMKKVKAEIGIEEVLRRISEAIDNA